MVLIRVELHQGTWADYQTLHAAMATQGFERTVVGANDNVRYALPTAEYIIVGSSLAHAIDAAAIAASRTNRRFGIVGMEGTGIRFRGLLRAE